MNRRLIILLSAVALAAATYVLGYSSFFTVSSVEVIGSKTAINSGVSIGQKLARVEPRAIAAKFETLDWVESADVSRNWINGKVTIQLTQRTPIAIFNNQVIDSTGKSFQLRSTPSKPLVQIQAGDLQAAISAVEFFTSLPEDLKSALTVVKVRSTGAFVLEINNAGKNLEIRWGTNTDNALKLKVYKALLALPENSAIKRVDVSAPHAPIVK
ncbi:MAG: FtsQ-type POTRA domain-containing protein [Acidobacteriota bacterium]|nr:FtsQ-type POTRA domain-containing protein [Acidobacteriota bacterium]